RAAPSTQYSVVRTWCFCSYHSHVSAPLTPKNTSTFSSLDPALKRSDRLRCERRVTVLALAAGLPGVAVCAFLLSIDGYAARVQWTVDLFLVLAWWSIAFNLTQRIVRPLQML